MTMIRAATNIPAGTSRPEISAATFNPQNWKRVQTGIFLGKYWGTGDRLKFIGIACGRGDTEEEAKKTATFRAHEIVRRAVEGLETNVLTGEFKPLAYRKDEERFICVLTDRNHKDKSLVEAENAAADAERERAAREEDERQARKSAERLQRQREERRLAEERERQSTTLVVEVQSLDTYAVELSFYSQTYRNRAWPGGDQVYILSDSDVHSYRLNCRKGEKICSAHGGEETRIRGGAPATVRSKDAAIAV